MMRETIFERRRMTVYDVPRGHGYVYAQNRGILAVREGEPNPYRREEYFRLGQKDTGQYDPCWGTFEGEWEGEDEGWGDCWFVFERNGHIHVAHATA